MCDRSFPKVHTRFSGSRSLFPRSNFTFPSFFFMTLYATQHSMSLYEAHKVAMVCTTVSQSAKGAERNFPEVRMASQDPDFHHGVPKVQRHFQDSSWGCSKVSQACRSMLVEAERFTFRRCSCPYIALVPLRLTQSNTAIVNFSNLLFYTYSSDILGMRACFLGAPRKIFTRLSGDLFHHQSTSIIVRSPT